MSVSLLKIEMLFSDATVDADQVYLGKTRRHCRYADLDTKNNDGDLNRSLIVRSTQSNDAVRRTQRSEL